MGILINGETNDILIDGESVATDAEVTAAHYTKTEADNLLLAKQTAAQVTAAITAQKASSTVYGTAKISVSGSTLTITTV